MGGGRVEIFAVGELGGAEGVEDDVFGFVVRSVVDLSAATTRICSGSCCASVWTATPGWEALMSHGCAAAWNSCRPVFIRLSVNPMTMVETTTPIIRAICCSRGVAPMR